MDKLCTIKSLLTDMRSLLGSVGESEWANCVASLQEEAARVQSGGDVKTLARNIMKLYGGMGSLTDLVVNYEGKPCQNENEDLDTMRKKLFDVAVNSLAK